MKKKKTVSVLAMAMLIVFFVANVVMAITITIDRSYRVGADSIREGTIDFDSSYNATNGGEAVGAASFNLRAIRWVELRPTKSSSNTSLYISRYNDTSTAIQVFVSTGVEAENTSDLSGLTGVKFRVLGY